MSTDKAIRELAHKMWLSEGQPEGKSETHWAQASIEVTRNTNTINLGSKRSIDPSEASGPIEPQQPDQT